MYNKEISTHHKSVIDITDGLLEFLMISHRYNPKILVIWLSISEIFAMMRLTKQKRLYFLRNKCSIKRQYYYAVLIMDDDHMLKQIDKNNFSSRKRD